MKVIGIDLAGCAKNPSGFALLSGREIKTGLVYSDDEIIELCIRGRPSVVTIDAPLSMPKRGSLREADASLIKRGFRVFPPTFAGMRRLTERGIRLAKNLRAKRIKVIETHPRTSGMLLFKTPDRKRWVAGLKRGGWRLKENAGEHEIDAAISALTGALYLSGEAEEVGEAREGVILIPLAKRKIAKPSLKRA